MTDVPSPSAPPFQLPDDERRARSQRVAPQTDVAMGDIPSWRELAGLSSAALLPWSRHLLLSGNGKESTRLRSMLYLAARRDSTTRGIHWSPLCDALVENAEWPSAADLSDYAAAERMPRLDTVLSPHAHAAKLEPWVRAQTTTAALHTLLRFRAHAVRTMVARTGTCFDPASVLAWLDEAPELGEAFAKNVALTSGTLDALQAWARARVIAGERGVLVSNGDHAQPGPGAMLAILARDPGRGITDVPDLIAGLRSNTAQIRRTCYRYLVDRLGLMTEDQLRATAAALPPRYAAHAVSLPLAGPALWAGVIAVAPPRSTALRRAFARHAAARQHPRVRPWLMTRVPGEVAHHLLSEASEKDLRRLFQLAVRHSPETALMSLLARPDLPAALATLRPTDLTPLLVSGVPDHVRTQALTILHAVTPMSKPKRAPAVRAPKGAR
jgi:hypothetical protein